MPYARYEAEQKGRVQLSNRLYAALRMVVDAKAQSIPAMSALEVDQRSFGALFHREYIEYNQNFDIFKLTDVGRRAYYTWEHTDIIKKQASTQFSHYIREIKSLSGNFKQMAPEGKRRGRAVVSIYTKSKKHHAVA